MFASVEEIVSFIRRAEFDFNHRLNLQNNNDVTVFHSSFETVSSDIRSQGDNLDILAEVSYFMKFSLLQLIVNLLSVTRGLDEIC